RAVGREAGRRIEVRAAGEDRDLARPEIDRDELVVPFAMARDRVRLVVLANGDEPVASRVVDRVGVAPVALRGERHELARADDAMEPAGREVGDDDEIARDKRRGAAVLVDAGARVEAFRRHSGERAVGLAPDEDLPTALVRAAFDPPPDAVDA